MLELWEWPSEVQGLVCAAPSSLASTHSSLNECPATELKLRMQNTYNLPIMRLFPILLNQDGEWKKMEASFHFNEKYHFLVNIVVVTTP